MKRDLYLFALHTSTGLLQACACQQILPRFYLDL